MHFGFGYSHSIQINGIAVKQFAIKWIMLCLNPVDYSICENGSSLFTVSTFKLLNVPEKF